MRWRLKSIPSRVLAFSLVSAALGCSTTHERILSPEEAAAHGLTGVIYDAPLCPTKLDKSGLKVSGPCEYVTCTPANGRVTCVARKHP